MRKDAGKFRRHVKKGLKAVTASLQSTAPSSDKSALLGLIRDSRSTYSLAREIEERRALRAISVAKAASPLNPRVHLAEGIFYLRRACYE